MKPFFSEQSPLLGALVLLTALGIIGILFGFVFDVGFGTPYDKVVHVVFFFALAGVLYQILPGRVFIVVALAAGIGAVGELLQDLTPNRTGSLTDSFADLVGILLWFAFVKMVLSVRSLRLRKLRS